MLPAESSTATVSKKPRWSAVEQAGVVVLVLILMLSIVFAILMLYANYNGQVCCTRSTGTEQLNMESYTLDSPVNVTLNIRNAGSATATLVNYYVKDSAGDQYSSTNWVWSVVSPNALIQANIIVDGNSVIFQSVNVYTVTVITARNYQFTYTVLA